MPSLLTASLLLSVLSLVSGSRLPDRNSLTVRAPGGLSWSPCYSNKNIECSQFNVPLDYANPSVGNANLAVIRYKATSKPRLGTLWINPGGPGGSGIRAISSGDGQLISNITGGYWDVASWDPRGVNNSTPRISCFASYDEDAAFWNGTIIQDGIEVKGAFTDQNDVTAFYNQVDRVDSLLTQLGQKCTSLSGDNLKYVGTTATARDLAALNDAAEGPGGLVNFWGFSYGSVIGTYFANMFPDRVGRFVLDGLVNPQTWAGGPVYKGWGQEISDSDEVLTAFSQACATAGPNLCGTAVSTDPKAIYQWFVDFLGLAYDAYKLGSMVSSASIRQVILAAMYQPRTWDDASIWLAHQWRNLNAVVQGQQYTTNATEDAAADAKLMAVLSAEGPISGNWKLGKALPGQDQGPVYSVQAITCSDAADATYTTRDVFDELVRVTKEVSPIFGPQWEDASLFCHKWPARAVERYAGPWNAKTKTTILVIGNEADPITPLQNAKWVADQLGDSAILIEQEGFGHTSLAMHSTCTLQTLSAYFISGKLPASGDKMCSTDQALFSPKDPDDLHVPIVKGMTAVPQATASATSQPNQTLAQASHANPSVAAPGASTQGTSSSSNGGSAGNGGLGNGVGITRPSSSAALVVLCFVAGIGLVL